MAAIKALEYNDQNTVIALEIIFTPKSIPSMLCNWKSLELF
jgi:hypothetical protein